MLETPAVGRLVDRGALGLRFADEKSFMSRSSNSPGPRDLSRRREGGRQRTAIGRAPASRNGEARGSAASREALASTLRLARACEGRNNSPSVQPRFWARI